nr:hypothetical protein CFP56_09388 [Quercus suber]
MLALRSTHSRRGRAREPAAERRDGDENEYEANCAGRAGGKSDEAPGDQARRSGLVLEEAGWAAGIFLIALIDTSDTPVSKARNDPFQHALIAVDLYAHDSIQVQICIQEHLNAAATELLAAGAPRGRQGA